ncbi:hypothetical protein [Flavobacterium sp. N2820]|uniref:hypothetical protein n=1 Tax=Flavobacterium sp. N2820 TaxID=2986834 RepID=UPI0022244626|nr:hypothetical protein [Flavobacterium sp. N2820]
MDSKTATITIEMAGGFDIDFSKSTEEIEKFIVDNLIKELTFRKESVKMATLTEKKKDKPMFRSIKFKEIKQNIELLF